MVYSDMKVASFQGGICELSIFPATIVFNEPQKKATRTRVYESYMYVITAGTHLLSIYVPDYS